MTMNEFKELTKNNTKEEVVRGLIKRKDPSVVKRGKGKYYIVDDLGTPIVSVRNLKV